ncbi:hypothetical protein [Rhodococcoides kroppenstedtii]|uniref:hypothetical protein n=1 Tax=Rhodococcoides kroppenstedtii TaxID=293050 RepID=UPI00363CEC0C
MSGDDVVERLDCLVTEQDGFFTRAQALDAGYRSADIATRVSEGSWTVVEADLLRVADWPRHAFEEFSKWCAWLGASAVISHQSASELHGMGSLHPQFVHVRVAGTAGPHDQRLALHRGRLVGDDIEFTGTFRMTTPTRTVLDLAAGGISQFTLDEVVADGLMLGRLDPTVLRRRADEAGDRVRDRVEASLR